MLDCHCDYDPPSVFSARTVAARKPYRCEECSAPILVGEKHEYAFGVWAGYPGAFRTCTDCVGIRKWVETNIPCFCWGYGNMIDDARDTIEAAYFHARDEVKGVAFGFGRLLVKARRNRHEKHHHVGQEG